MTATMNQIIHVNELSAFPDAVYVGRAMPRQRLAASPFANPFRVEDHGRHMACLMYRDYLRSSVEGMKVLAMLPELRGKPLACWCRKSNATGRAWQECHADQIVRLLNEHTDDELRAFAVTATRDQEGTG